MTGEGGHRRRAVPATGVLLAVLLGVGGCSTGAPPTVVPARDPAVAATDGTREGAAPAPGRVPAPFVPAGEELSDADLSTFGDRLTAALASGDVEHWLSYFALDEEQTDRQRDWFAAVQAVPMELREMHPTYRHGPDEMQVSVDGDWSSGERVEFGFRHQVVGADPVPSVQSYGFWLEPSAEDGALRITDVTGVEDAGDYPQLWDVGPVEVTESEHLVLLADPAETELVGELLPGLDTAAAQSLAEFPVEGVDRMVVTLTTPELVATLFGEGEVNDLAGFAMPLPGAPEVAQRGGLTDLGTADDVTVRLVLDLEYTADELDTYGEDVAGGSPLLRHEGTHLAMLMRHVEGDPPLWTSEGFAGWFEVVGADEPMDDLRWWYGVMLQEVGPPTTLPPALWLTFHSDEPGEVDRNYAASAMVFRYVEETYGYEVTVALGDQLHQIGLWDQDGAVDDALREHLGVGREEFVADWTAWVAEQYPDAGAGD